MTRRTKEEVVIDALMLFFESDRNAPFLDELSAPRQPLQRLSREELVQLGPTEIASIAITNAADSAPSAYGESFIILRAYRNAFATGKSVTLSEKDCDDVICHLQKISHGIDQAVTCANGIVKLDSVWENAKAAADSAYDVIVKGRCGTNRQRRHYPAVSHHLPTLKADPLCQEQLFLVFAIHRQMGKQIPFIDTLSAWARVNVQAAKTFKIYDGLETLSELKKVYLDLKTQYPDHPDRVRDDFCLDSISLNQLREMAAGLRKLDGHVLGAGKNSLLSQGMSEDVRIAINTANRVFSDFPVLFPTKTQLDGVGG